MTPFNPVKSHCNSLQRARFDHKDDYQRVLAAEVFRQHHLLRSTAYDWLRERDGIGQVSARRHDGRVEKQLLRGTRGPGRPHKIPDSTLNQLIQSDQGSRRRKLQTELRVASIDASHRTLQRSLRDRKCAGMYSASTQKKITKPQASQRQNYFAINQYKPAVGYWDGINFTDEAHMALDDYPADWILRVEGQRSAPENVVNHPDRGANVVHFAAWINYYTKAEELIFYNDEYDDYVAPKPPPKPPPKPRSRPTTDSPGDYEARVHEWEAAKARELVIVKPGNSMRAIYYVENILPKYCTACPSSIHCTAH